MTSIHIQIKQKFHQNTQQAVINNFQLQVSSGEFVCLVGQSGCGKTTLLNCIAGIDTNYQGNIQIDSKNQSAKIGYVFQRPCLLPWRTVKENIELACLANNCASHIKIDDLLCFMQLDKQKHHYPNQLSEGMRRRVSIIRAFAIEPDLLLMDEPFVSLDAPMAREVRECLLQLWITRPHTVLFVTHDLREAIALADRLIFLTSQPMCILRMVQITLNRQIRNQSDVIEKFITDLLHDYPDLKPML